MIFKISILFYLASAKAADSNCIIFEFSQAENIIKNCKSIVVSNIEVPAGLTWELDLQNGTTVTFNGTVLFRNASWVGPLIKFKGDNVFVQGTKDSVFDGQGALYWDGKGGMDGLAKPYFFQIETTGGSVFQNISLLNCPHHCVIIASSDLTISGWDVDVSDGDKDNLGHNTDGFDIIEGKNIVIENSRVQNQDDCVAINRGSNMLISNLYCHGSHGLSLSVGFSKHSYIHNTVQNVTFTNCTVVNSANGIHVKTHTDGYFGEITNVTYRNIQISGIVNFGVSIQQDYKNGSSTGVPVNNIPITNLTLTNITGTMTGNKAMSMYINCASDGCFNWNWKDVSITGASKKSICSYEPVGYDC